MTPDAPQPPEPTQEAQRFEAYQLVMEFTGKWIGDLRWRHWHTDSMVDFILAHTADLRERLAKAGERISELEASLKALDESHEEDRQAWGLDRERIVDENIARINENDALLGRLAKAERERDDLSARLRLMDQRLVLCGQCGATYQEVPGYDHHCEPPR